MFVIHLSPSVNLFIRGYNQVIFTTQLNKIGLGIFIHENLPFQETLINKNINLITIK